MPLLKEIDCVNNMNLSSITFSNLPSLEILTCSNYKITELDVTPIPTLHILRCCRCSLLSLDVNSCKELAVLNCSGNKFASLDLSENRKLIEFRKENGALEEIDVRNCRFLRSFECSNNKLKGLRIPEDNNLRNLMIPGNDITSLDLSHCTKLTELNCSRNPLHTLDTTGAPSMQVLKCAWCRLSSIDTLCRNRFIRLLDCDTNNLAMLDLSQCVALESISCSGNPLKDIILSDSEYLTGLRVYMIADTDQQTLNLRVSIVHNPNWDHDTKRVITRLRRVFPRCDASKNAPTFSLISNTSTEQSFITRYSLQYLDHSRFLIVSLNELHFVQTHCCVCLDDYTEETEIVEIIPCRHNMCLRCIQRFDYCPICNISF